MVLCRGQHPSQRLCSSLMNGTPPKAGSVRIAIDQLSMRLGDLDANLEKLEAAAEKAVSKGAGLLITPELGLTGYHLKDAVCDVAIGRGSTVWRRLEKLSRRIDLVAGFVEQSRAHQYYNAAGYFSAGETTHVHRKVYLPTYGMFDEQRYFARGSRIDVFETRIGRVVILICEDAWHPSAVYLASLQNPEILIIPSSSPMRGIAARPGKRETRRAASSTGWEEMNRTYARLYSVHLAYANRVGVEDGVGFSGGSHIVDPHGQTILQAPYGEEFLLLADIDKSDIRRSRQQTPVIRDENFEFTFSEMERIRRLRWEQEPG